MKEMYEPKYGYFKDPLTDRVVCMCCFEGKHKQCIHGDCRCLHNFSTRPRKPKKDTSSQQDMQQFGTIEI